MFLRTTTVVFGALCLAQTVAASGVPTSARRVQGLHSRSLTVIPAACQTGCQPFTPFLAGASCPVTECCSTIFQTGYFECFKCVGVSTNATDFSIAQEYVDVLTTSCISEGFPLTERTFPGQNPARTLATALAPGASAIPVFSSGPPAAPPAAPSGSVVRHSTVLAPSHLRLDEQDRRKRLGRFPEHCLGRLPEYLLGLLHQLWFAKLCDVPALTEYRHNLPDP
ncbi:hypothetical protein DFH09DRAFT_1314499 [Mycena vulgaris]|nr:hypothetical protein DFH09DRAFT_1314499 [Mycena vulgaris]